MKRLLLSVGILLNTFTTSCKTADGGSGLRDTGTPATAKQPETGLEGAFAQAASAAVKELGAQAPDLKAITFGPVEHPELVSFSGTGQHAWAIFGNGQKKDLGDVVVENYLSMNADELVAAVKNELIAALSPKKPVATGPTPQNPNDGKLMLSKTDIDAAKADADPFLAGATAAIGKVKSKLPKLQNIKFSDLSADATVSFSGTGMHATAVFNDGTERDLGDVIVENYLGMESMDFALTVGQQILDQLTKL